MSMNWETLMSTRRLGTEGSGNKKPKGGESSLFNDFDQDYGRAVFSSPVRRLQDKAQVFPMDPTDAVRTRLTHSLEVSSVARGLARKVAYDERKTLKCAGVDPRDVETVTATAALLHDIGNPPFGHAGEGAMRDWFQRKSKENGQFANIHEDYQAEFLNFEGNAQSIRLVTRLQILLKDEGLNLTCATLSALQKYTTVAHETVNKGVHSRKKPGFFSSERDQVVKFRKSAGVPEGARNPMALLMEAADDICFAVVDIEDGVKKGVISWKTITDCLGTGEADDKDLRDELLGKVGSYFEDNGGAQQDLLPNTKDEVQVQMLRVYFIGMAVESIRTAFREKRESIFAGTYTDELKNDSKCSLIFEDLKRLAGDHVYSSSSILKLELRGRRVISDLMDFFWMGAESATFDSPSPDCRSGMAMRAYELISPNYRRIFERAKDQPEVETIGIEYLRYQLVADQVCGMTDSYACRLHEELCGG